MLKPPGHNLGQRRHAACKHTGLTRLLRMPALSRRWRPSLSWRTSTTSNTTACSAPVRVPAGGDTLIALCGASAGHPPGTCPGFVMLLCLQSQARALRNGHSHA